MATIICLDGLIGAGKSSLMQKLAPYYPTFPEPLEKWTLLPKFYADQKLHALAFQLQVSVSQYEQSLAFPPQGIVLVERCPWTSRHIFAPLLFDYDTLTLYHAIYKRLAYAVDHFIYLDIHPVRAYERIRSRSRVDSEIPLRYLEELHHRYTTHLRSKPNVLTVDADRPLDQVAADVLTKIASICPGEC